MAMIKSSFLSNLMLLPELNVLLANELGTSSIAKIVRALD